MSTTEIYNYVPASLTVTGGGMVSIHPTSISVTKQVTEVYSIDGDSVKLNAGPGTISFGGPIKIDKNVDDIIGHLSDTVTSITIEDITYSGCKCVQSQVSIQGSAQQTIYLEGSLSYEYDISNALIPVSFTLSGGVTGNLLVQNISRREQTQDVYSINHDPFKTPASTFSVSMSGIVIPNGGVLSPVAILDALNGEAVDITVGSHTLTSCTCVESSIQVTGQSSSATYTSGQLTYSYERDNTLIPGTITLTRQEENAETASPFAEVAVLNVQIQKQGNTIRLPNWDQFTGTGEGGDPVEGDYDPPSLKFIVGEGSITISGIILETVGGSGEDADDIDPSAVIAFLEENTLDIVLGDVTYSGCRCVGASLSVSGAHKSVVKLEGSIRYVFDLETGNFPGITEALFTWEAMEGVRNEWTEVFDVVEDGVFKKVRHIYGQFMYTARRKLRFDSDTFYSGSMLDDANASASSLGAFLFINSGNDVTFRSSKSLSDNTTTLARKWRPVEWRIQFAEEGIAEYIEVWAGSDAAELLDTYETIPGAGAI